MDAKKMTNNYLEALRCMEKARDILKNKAREEDGLYQSKRYVREACALAYLAALLAAEAYLVGKGRPIPKRRDKRGNIHDYKHELAGVDEEMLTYLDAAWGSLHCGGYHEGVVVAKMIQAGMECADFLINAIRPATEEARVATV
ncbi:MAG: hypothetical protein CRN43_07090 [Candidatus Nephrothrix sp. EaCA]|nr:MAG: hypothetical protein CRN43_07090 [Candidatus Nephrothrix sp. EaCA]